MSRSYRKNPVRWQCCNSCKKEKQIYNRRMRHNNKLILKDYNDNTVLQVHKRDGLSCGIGHAMAKAIYGYIKKIY